MHTFIEKYHSYIFGSVALSMALLFVSCGEGTASTAPNAYKTMCVKRQDYTLVRRFMAKIESQQRIDVRPVIGGTLKKICIREGGVIKQGEPLFIIDQAPYIAAVNAAKAQVATARATLSTAQLNTKGKEQLYAKQMVGEFDLRRARHAQEEAAAQLKAAEAELTTARTNLNYTTITSPVNGTMSIIDFREGELVDPSVPIANISANNHIYAYTSLSGKMLDNLFEEYDCSSTNELISKMPAVMLYTIWGEELPQKGHFDAISGGADASTGAVTIRASFYNPSELFRNGSNGYLYLPTTKKAVYVIPQDATTHIQDKYFVYRVVEGKAVSTEVKVLPASNEQHYVVTSGLNDGDVIISEKAGMVREGISVASEAKK